MFTRMDMSLSGDHLVAKLLHVPPRILLLCLHTCVTLTIVVCLVASIILIKISQIDYHNNKFLLHCWGYKEYFFSLWVLFPQVICFMTYSVIDVVVFCIKPSPKALKLKKFLYNVASHLMFSFAFPLSIVVSMLFWGFYFWNREVIYPKVMDDLFPPFMNHVMHTLPVPFCLLYMFTDIKEEPPKTKTFLSLVAFMSIYSIVFFWPVKTRGEWIYPALDALTPSQITWVLSSTLIGSFVFYFLGYYVYSKIKEVRIYFGSELKTSLKLKLKES